MIRVLSVYSKVKPVIWGVILGVFLPSKFEGDNSLNSHLFMRNQYSKKILNFNALVKMTLDPWNRPRQYFGLSILVLGELKTWSNKNIYQNDFVKQ